MTLAALLSLSWTVPHTGQVNVLIFKGFLPVGDRQFEQVCDEGSHLSTLISILPLRSLLYSSWRLNSPQATSATYFIYILVIIL